MQMSYLKWEMENFYCVISKFADKAEAYAPRPKASVRSGTVPRRKQGD
jgi:hypothetical protein